MPEKLKEGLDELIDFYLDLLPLELEQNFIDSFRIGNQMMLEVYTTPIDNEENTWIMIGATAIIRGFPYSLPT